MQSLSWTLLSILKKVSLNNMSIPENVLVVGFRFLKRHTSVQDMKVFKYLSMHLTSKQVFKPEKISESDLEIIYRLINLGHLSLENDYLKTTKRFYDFLQEILWEFYKGRIELK